MTTSVKITACCGEDTEVKINLSSEIYADEEHTLQSGEELELHVYDDREINVKEVVKTA